MTGEAGAPGETRRDRAREVVLSVMHDYDAWSPEAEYQRFRVTLIEVVRAALARVEAETLERAAQTAERWGRIGVSARIAWSIRALAPEVVSTDAPTKGA